MSNGETSEPRIVLTQEQWRELSARMRDNQSISVWIISSASKPRGGDRPECVAITTGDVDEVATLITFLAHLIEVTRHPQDSVPTALEDLREVAQRIETHHVEGSRYPTYFLRAVTVERSGS